MNNLLTDIKLAPESGFRGFGQLGLEGLSEESAGTTFNTFVSTAIGVMTIIAFVWFVFTLFVGAYGFMTAGGDKQALESAKKKITTGIIGVVIVIAAIFIFQLVGYILGIPNILNPGEMIRQISQ
jgi:hypothetical protein